MSTIGSEQEWSDALRKSDLQAARSSKAFRDLREAWFNTNLASRAHEREWETEEDQVTREESNKAKRLEYDKDTEAILQGEGEGGMIAPRCWNDLGRRKKSDEAYSAGMDQELRRSVD